MSGKRFYFSLACAILLMLIHAHADYLLQAYQHGWATWLDLHGRAMKWPWYLDVLPRDLWHLVQSVRNLSVIVAVTLLLQVTIRDKWEGRFACTRVGLRLWDSILNVLGWMHRHHLPNGNSGTPKKIWSALWFIIEAGIPLLLYGATRAVGFSIVYAAMN
jgi:hypothetical protein